MLRRGQLTQPPNHYLVLSASPILAQATPEINPVADLGLIMTEEAPFPISEYFIPRALWHAVRDGTASRYDAEQHIERWRLEGMIPVADAFAVELDRICPQ
jgi:hypothetical protein